MRELQMLIIALIMFCGCERVEDSSVTSKTSSNVNVISNKLDVPVEEKIGRAWFLMAIGATETAPPGTTAGIAYFQPIESIINSVIFGEDGVPIWTLPEGWLQQTIIEGRRYEFVHENGARIHVRSSDTTDVESENTIRNRLNEWSADLGLPQLPVKEWMTASGLQSVHKFASNTHSKYVFQFGQTKPKITDTTKSFIFQGNEYPSNTSMTMVGYVLVYLNP